MQFTLGQRNECSLIFRIDFHFFVQAIAHQPHSVGRKRIVHPAVNVILVYTQFYQFINNRINFFVVGVVGKSTCIGHHAHINAFGATQIDVRKMSHPADSPENKLACR